MKILNKLKYIKYRFSKRYCFDEMCNTGNVTKNKKCGGLCGGDKQTNYLNYSCIDCNYLDNEVLRKVE